MPHISIMHQWNGWKAVSSARSVLMAANATVDTATEERGFFCGAFYKQCS
jgi:hypothetical protein